MLLGTARAVADPIDFVCEGDFAALENTREVADGDFVGGTNVDDGAPFVFGFAVSVVGFAGALKH